MARTGISAILATTYLVGDIEGLNSRIDDELVVGRYDTGIVDSSHETHTHRKQPISLQPTHIFLCP